MAQNRNEFVMGASPMKSVVTAWESVEGLSLHYHTIKATYSGYKDVSHDAPFKLTRIHEPTALMLT
jgi:hypothetical protein